MIIKSNDNKEKWQSIVEAQISSGQTQIKWCDEQNVSIHKFRYWKRRLNEKQELSEGSNGFVAIKPTTVSKTSKMRINIGKATIEIDEEVDPMFLSSVVKVLSDHV